MKINIILGLVVVMLGYITCKSLSQKTPGPTTDVSENTILQVQETERKASEWRAAHVLSSNPDSAAPVQIHRAPEMVNVPMGTLAPATASRKAYLSTGWWHCTMAFSGTDSLIHLNYQQKWLKFQEDQSFQVLIKGKPVDNGRWAFDEEKNQIYLSCKDPYINNTWQVQDKGFVMVLKGNTDLNFTGIQLRIACNKTQPNWN